MAQTQTEDLTDQSKRLVQSLGDYFVAAGDKIAVTFASVEPLSWVQQQLLKARLSSEIAIDNISQNIARVASGNVGEKAESPPQLGDAQITLSGVPAAGGTAAQIVTRLALAFSALGVSVAAVQFAHKSDNIPQDLKDSGAAVADTAAKISIPLILILLLVLFILKEYNRNN